MEAAAIGAEDLMGAAEARLECPKCGRDLIPHTRYVSGRGYLIVAACAGSDGTDPACDYRRTL